MTIRNLDRLFAPESIAVLGALSSPEDDSARILVRNLKAANFRGLIMPVSTHAVDIEGVPAHSDINALPTAPELAVFTKSGPETPEIIERLGRFGTRGVILADRTDAPPDPERREQARERVLAIARQNDMRVLGPAGLGLIVPGHGLNASFSDTTPLPGSAALVTQSSGVFRAALEWATARSLGFSHLISLGAAIDVSFGDVLDFLAGDYKARAILLYLEQVRDPRRFLSAARRAARTKPVIVYKPESSSRDKASDAVYDAAFRRAGVLRVHRLTDLLNSVETLTLAKPPSRDRLAIVANSRSLGLAALDTLNHGGGTLAQFSPETQEALSAMFGRFVKVENPLDLGDYATAEVFRRTLETLADDGQVSGVLLICGPGALGSNADVADVLISLRSRFKRKLLISCWPGSMSGIGIRRRLREASIPSYEDPGEAVREYLALVQYKSRQRLLTETPKSIPEHFSPDHERAHSIIQRVVDSGREWLNEREAMELLAAYKAPVVETYWADDPTAAADIARNLQWPIALKLVTPDVSSKSEVGGVALGLAEPDEVSLEAAEMIERLRKVQPSARVSGFVIQPMVPREGSFELKAGFESGGEFGPVIYFGHGGTEAEVIDDQAYGLPPLNMHLARELMSRTRVFGMLDGNLVRRADVEALALTLVKLSQLVVDCPAIEQLDINPLWSNADRLVLLDARVRVSNPHKAQTRRLAIRPYPKHLEETIVVAAVGELILRPLLPEDEPELQAFNERCDPEDLRLRFFQPMRHLSHEMAARLTQLDYERDMALALARPGPAGESAIHAVVRMSSDPDERRAEYAIILERIIRGNGALLMQRMIGYARSRGLVELYGEVLRENKGMLRLNRALGFDIRTDPEDATIMCVTLRLQDQSD